MFKLVESGIRQQLKFGRPDALTVSYNRTKEPLTAFASADTTEFTFRHQSLHKSLHKSIDAKSLELINS